MGEGGRGVIGEEGGEEGDEEGVVGYGKGLCRSGRGG